MLGSGKENVGSPHRSTVKSGGMKLLSTPKRHAIPLSSSSGPAEKGLQSGPRRVLMKVVDKSTPLKGIRTPLKTKGINTIMSSPAPGSSSPGAPPSTTTAITSFSSGIGGSGSVQLNFNSVAVPSQPASSVNSANASGGGGSGGAMVSSSTSSTPSRAVRIPRSQTSPAV